MSIFWKKSSGKNFISGKKKSSAIAFNPRYKIFIIYIVFFDNFNKNYKENIYFSGKIHITILIANNTSTLILLKYPDFAEIFFLE